MAFWRLNSLTFLGLAAGALSCCILLPSARAGDKIMFSAPGTSLAVPKVERDDTEIPKPEFQPSISGDGIYLEDNMQASSTIVIISASKKKGTRTADSTFADNVDNDTDADNRYDSLDFKPRPNKDSARLQDMQRAGNGDAGSAFSERRSDEAASQESLRTRLEALNTEGRTDYQMDERYGRHASEANEAPTWFRGFFQHGSLASERIQEGQFVPFYEEMKTVNDQPSQEYLSARLASAADDLLRDSTLPPGVAEYNAQRDAVRGKTSDETVNAPRMSRPLEIRPELSLPDAFVRQEPPSSPPGQVQSRPAILPFPKRPGDLLR